MSKRQQPDQKVDIYLHNEAIPPQKNNAMHKGNLTFQIIVLLNISLLLWTEES